MPRSGGFPSARKRQHATCTTAGLHLYADGTSGDDANDGLSAAAPKKTLAAVWALVPDVVLHHSVVHLSGTFSLGVATELASKRAASGALIIDGGDDVTDLGGGNKTATSSSTSSITVAGAGWVVDAYAGCQLRVLSGAAIGNVRAVHRNTADTIYPTANFSADPGVGATFDLVRPATTIDGSGLYIDIESLEYWFRAYIQRIYLNNSSLQVVGTSGGSITGLMCGAATTLWFLGGQRLFNLGFDNVVDVSNLGSGAMPNTVSQYRAGLHCPKKLYVYSNTFQLANAVVGELLAYQPRLLNIKYGTRLTGPVELRQAQMVDFDSTSGYQPTLVSGSTGVGILAKDCGLVEIGAIEVSNCGGHAIEARRTGVEFTGATSGSGNTGAGVYAHSGSVVHTKSGSPPTLTGTVGDLSTDGTTQKSTWAAIEAGTPVSDTAEMTMAKKVA